MADFLIPILIGVVIAVPIVVAIRTARSRAEREKLSAPQTPVSRQHRRAIERRMNKGR